VASKPRTPMAMSDRAKIFLPFAAVKGLPEALAKKEKESTNRVELSEELEIKLNEQIHFIKKGSQVTVTYYHIDAYTQITGAIFEIDFVYKTLLVEDTLIEMSDIFNIDVKV